MFLNQDSNFVLKAQLTNAVATSQVKISIAYHDNTQTYHPDAIVLTNDTTEVVLLAAPTEGLVNIVETIKIYNPDTQANTIEILAGNTVIYTCTIGSKESLVLSEEATGNGLGYIPLAPDGDGSELTNLNASNISSGTIGSDYLPMASESVLGAVKIDGSTININDGVISSTVESRVKLGTCSTVSAAAEKTVTLNNFSLTTGATVEVIFSNTNTATTPTLNVNSTGSLSIADESGTVASANNPFYVPAGTTVEFVYNGTYWVYKNRVVTSYLNGVSQYRQWSNGFIEQTGQANINQLDTTITLPKSFITTTYDVKMQMIGSGSGVYNVYPHTNSTGSFTATCSYQGALCSWTAKGY